MAALAIAAAGLALSGFGIYQQYQAGQEQIRANERQAQFLSQQTAHQNEALEFQKKEQAERRKAMELDSMRRRREIVRSSVASRSLALAVATNQGAQFGSGLPGAYAGIAGRSGVNDLGVTQNLEIGGNIFDLKGKQFDAYKLAAEAGTNAAIAGFSSSGSLGQGLSSLGNQLVTNSGMIAKIGTYGASLFSPPPIASGTSF